MQETLARVSAGPDVLRTFTHTGLRERHTVVSVGSYLPNAAFFRPDNDESADKRDLIC